MIKQILKDCALAIIFVAGLYGFALLVLGLAPY
jgi:hypothetical protein